MSKIIKAKAKKIISMILSLIIGISIIPISASNVLAEINDTISVSFIVEDSVNNPIENAAITIFVDSGMGNELDSERTDADGHVTFELEEHDVYYYCVEAEDMIEITDAFIKNDADIINVTMKYSAICHSCHGPGECYECEGAGEVIKESVCEQCNGIGTVETVCDDCNGIDSEDCSTCNGTGISEEICSVCNGSKILQIKEECTACNGSGECQDCNGKGIVEAYDDFDFKFETNPKIKYGSEKIPNPVTVTASEGKISYSSDDENIVCVDEEGNLTATGNAGDEATITASIGYDKVNGYAPKEAQCKVTIVEADYETIITGNNLQYNGLNQKLVTIEDEAIESVSYTVNGVASDGTAKDAGDYEVKVNVVKDGNHAEYSDTVNVTIEKAPVKIIPNANQEKYFNSYAVNTDGKPFEYSVEGEQNEDKVIIEGNLSYENINDDDEIGKSYKITQGDLKLSSDSVNDNYEMLFDDSAAVKVINFKTDASAQINDKDIAIDEYWFNKEYIQGTDSCEGRKCVTIKAPDGYLISTENKRSGNWSECITITEDGNYDRYTYYLKENEFGSVSDAKLLSFGIDTVEPEFNSVTFSADKNIFNSIGRLLKYGSFFKHQLIADVASSDSLSGVETVKVCFADADNENDYIYLSEDNEKFVIANDGQTVTGRFFVYVEDKAGNVNTNVNRIVTTENSNIEDEDSCVIMIENNAPVLTNSNNGSKINIIPLNERDNDRYNTSDKEFAYSNDVNFEFTLTDQESGLYYTQIIVNGQKLDKYQYSYESIKTYTDSYIVNTADFEADEDGKYVLAAEYTDAAGNVDTAVETVYIDRHAPIVKSFEITGLIGTKNDTSVPHAVFSTTYGYYFSESATVNVTFGDYSEDNEFLSGIKEVYIYLVDKDSNNIYQITKDGTMELISSLDEISAIPVSELDDIKDDTNDIKSFEFTVDKDFKGQIYAKAVDNVGNDLSVPSTDAGVLIPSDVKSIIGEDISYNDAGFQKPNGSIVESEDLHNDNTISGITINLKTSDNTDAEGLALYGDNVYLDISVWDRYSGIESIEVSVNAPQDKNENYSHTLKIGNTSTKESLTYTQNSDLREQDWAIVNTDENLITEVSNTIEVSNDSNAIVVTVKLIDRAGHTSTASKTFSIDKTSPQIEVSYDNNSVMNGKYYQDHRIPTVTIKERNLIGSNISFTAIRDNETINVNTDYLKLINGELTVDEETDKAYYTYVLDPNSKEYKDILSALRFTYQGDYEFNVSAVDNSGKTTYYRAENEEFSIDTSTPMIRVEFDNDSAENGNYYKEKRTATITVTDRYFDSSKTVIDITSYNNGVKDEKVPSASNWTNQNDRYEQSCTVTFDEERTYSFTVDSTDLSGKAASQYTVSDFNIDNNDPVIKITINDKEIKDGGREAYLEDVLPEIKIEDTNFDSLNTTVVLTPAVKRDNVLLNYESEPIALNPDQENGMVYTYKNFSSEEGHQRIYDNIYTLTVETTDKSGRTAQSQTVTFSVNRHGSTYMFDVNPYYKEKPVIQVTEVNVNPLDLEADDTYVNVISSSGSTQRLISKDNIIKRSEPNTANNNTENWYEYVYAIPSSCFSIDDYYSIKISSVDTAKKISTNVNEENNLPINFTVDETNPYFEVTNYTENEKLDESSFTLDLKLLDDTSGIAKYEVYFDGQPIAVEDVKESYKNKITVSVPVDGDSANKLSDASGRTLSVKIWDAAANDNFSDLASEYYEYNVRISTNFFVNAFATLQDFYANTLAFWSTMAGIIVVVGAVTWIIIAKKKKSNNKEISN